MKNRVKSSKIELRFREVRSEGCTSCTPVLQALIIFQYALLRLCFGRAVFCCPFPGEQGSTTAHLRRLPRKGRAGGAQNLCSSIACRAQPCQRCSPVLQALIYLSMHFYGSASAEPFFAAHFSGEQGSTTAHLRRLALPASNYSKRRFFFYPYQRYSSILPQA